MIPIKAGTQGKAVSVVPFIVRGKQHPSIMQQAPVGEGRLEYPYVLP
jgi:hypothetical protein